MNEQHSWTVFFGAVAMWTAITIDILSEEMDDPANIAAWNAAIDMYRERIKPIAVHTAEHPYCLMSDCPCHDDAQDEPITDELLRISAHFQGMMDSLLLEHD